MKDSEVILYDKKSSVNGPKNSKVLIQLKDMYTSGFSSHSPTRPLLTARTMQALYGLSFIVYFVVIVSDWVYLYFLLRGYIATFPLQTWAAVAYVSAVVVATMLICLLIVLCVENAFAQPNDITEFSAGCAVINESFTQWVQVIPALTNEKRCGVLMAFNNFRISFLFMLFHDIPITVLNFFYVAPCRCAGPQVKHWPVALICSTTLAAVYWRLVLLYFAYRRTICPLKKSDSATSVLATNSFFAKVKSNFDKSKPRLDEYDECWPVRFAYNILYKTSNQKIYCNGEVLPRRKGKANTKTSWPILQQVWKWTKQICRALICIVFILILYICYAFVLCFPCYYHYAFRPKSPSNRHKCAQSFVLYFSRVFHCVMFTISMLSVLSLIFFNVTLLFSAHAVGNNPLPYEIKQLCVEINIQSQVIKPRLASKTLEGEGNDTLLYRCKPIWDDGGFELGFKRKEAGPWQTRVELSTKQLLVISTLISMNYSDRDNPRHRVFYDFALLKKMDPLLTERFSCYKDIFSKWQFDEDISMPGWPYFEACDNTWSSHKEILIRCLQTKPYNLLYL